MISIIMPVYNAEKYINTALQSIQTTKDIHLEIICVNDGSTDESVKIINAYQDAMTNAQITIKIITQQNEGAAAARNTGLKNATMPYVMFLDSDDQLAPNAIDHFYEAIQKYPTKTVYIGQLVHFKNQQIQKIKTQQIYEGETTLSQQPQLLQSIGPGAKVYRRKMIKKGFDQGITFCEEHTFNTRLFLGEVYVLSEVVYYYNQDDRGSVTQSLNKVSHYLKDAYKVRNQMFTLLNTTKNIETNAQCDAVKKYYSYRMDYLIVHFLIKNALENGITIKFSSTVLPYLSLVFDDVYDEYRIAQFINTLMRYLNKSERKTMLNFLQMQKYDTSKLTMNPNKKIQFAIKKTLLNQKDSIKQRIKKRLRP